MLYGNSIAVAAADAASAADKQEIISITFGSFHLYFIRLFI